MVFECVGIFLLQSLPRVANWVYVDPLEKAIESGNALDDETMQRVTKLHTVLRPYLLRRLKRDVEKELPSKYEHLVLCPLSKRQRYLYDEFMARAQTRDALQSGIYQRIANILMQLRKVCNHPDLFEVRQIVTSFAMPRSAVANFEIKEFLVRKRWLEGCDDDGEGWGGQRPTVNLDLLGLSTLRNPRPGWAIEEISALDASDKLPFVSEIVGHPPPKDTRTIAGYKRWTAYKRKADSIVHWTHMAYVNRIRCHQPMPLYTDEQIRLAKTRYQPLLPLAHIVPGVDHLNTMARISRAVLSYDERAASMAHIIDKFAFVTPAVVVLDLPQITLPEHTRASIKHHVALNPTFAALLHRPSVKLQIAFPDPSLLQYDCGKLQELARLLREKKAGGHRVLIFTQMTRVLDILEIFLNYNGYLYLRLDGATKIEDRQYVTERFNADERVFCFIASSRSGGVGIK